MITKLTEEQKLQVQLVQNQNQPKVEKQKVEVPQEIQQMMVGLKQKWIRCPSQPKRCHS